MKCLTPLSVIGIILVTVSHSHPYSNNEPNALDGRIDLLPWDDLTQETDTPPYASYIHQREILDKSESTVLLRGNDTLNATRYVSTKVDDECDRGINLFLSPDRAMYTTTILDKKTYSQWQANLVYVWAQNKFYYIIRRDDQIFASSLIGKEGGRGEGSKVKLDPYYYIFGRVQEPQEASLTDLVDMQRSKQILQNINSAMLDNLKGKTNRKIDSESRNSPTNIQYGIDLLTLNTHTIQTTVLDERQEVMTQDVFLTRLGYGGSSMFYITPNGYHCITTIGRFTKDLKTMLYWDTLQLSFDLGSSEVNYGLWVNGKEIKNPEAVDTWNDFVV